MSLPGYVPAIGERDLDKIIRAIRNLYEQAAAGAASSTDNAVARFDGTTGKVLQNSALVVDDSGHITSFGGNIAFPATQAASAGANVLDDYEEGTFTPAFAFGGGTTGITYGAQVGSYTKIGRVVFFQANVLLTAKGSSTGAWTLTGLPFTSANTANQYHSVVLYVEDLVVGDREHVGLIAPNSTSMSVYVIIGGNSVAADDTYATATSQIIASGFYIV